MDIRSVQCWPAGKTYRYSGDPMGPVEQLEIHDGETGRMATEDERRAIRREVVAERLLEREVLCLDSCLVDALLLADQEGVMTGDLRGEFSWDNVSNLRVDPSDWDAEKCYDWLNGNGRDTPGDNPWEMTRAELVEFLTDNGTGNPEEDCPNGTDDAGLLALAIDRHFDDGSDNLSELRDAVRDHETDAEVYEWRRVTKWLANRLDEIGEPVLDNDFGCWHGRTATGQSFLMDGTLQQVAELID